MSRHCIPWRCDQCESFGQTEFDAADLPEFCRTFNYVWDFASYRHKAKAPECSGRVFFPDYSTEPTPEEWVAAA